MAGEALKEPVPHETGWRAARADVVEIFHGLIDVQLRSVVTTKMAPVIYIFLVAGAGAVDFYLMLQAFQHSLGFGLVYLLLILPLTFIAAVIAVRVGMEVILSIFRILVNMESMMGQMNTLRGQTEAIAEDMPRIQFWRGRKKRGSGDDEPPPDPPVADKNQDPAK